MSTETLRKSIGKGRSCGKCRIKLGTHEECYEDDEKVYHTGCRPTVAQTGKVTVEFVHSLGHSRQTAYQAQPSRANSQ